MSTSTPTPETHADHIGHIPAGDARREELRRRTDDLAERAETQAPERVAFDAARLAPDRDIRRAFHAVTDELFISNEVDGYAYKWANWETRHGAMVNDALGQRVYVDGAWCPTWEIVKGHDADRARFPEAWEHRTADGTRRVGDALLLRCPLDRFALLEAARHRRNAEREAGVAGPLLELAERHRDTGIVVTPFKMDPNDPALGAKQALARGPLDAALRRGDMRSLGRPGR